MIARLLTSEEIENFQWSHPFWNWPSIPEEGSWFEAPELGGNILVFPKTTGEIIFVLTETPIPSEPSALAYVTQQTLAAVKQNIGVVAESITGSLIPLIAGGLILLAVILWKK